MFLLIAVNLASMQEIELLRYENKSSEQKEIDLSLKCSKGKI